MLENDLVGVGVGPTNLSLASLIQTARVSGLAHLQSKFLEKNCAIRWHSGQLFPAISSQEWQTDSDRTKRRFNQKTTMYVFCSKQMPAFLDSGESGLQTTFLAPDREDDYGHANEIAYWFYFAVCHGKLIDSAEQGAQLARTHGYKVEPVDTQPSFARAEDILTFDPRRAH
jgi:hypothetical protein